MKAVKDCQVAGQLSIFDIFSRDIWSGKMLQEHSVQTTETISELSLKKSAKLQTKTPMFLNLKKGKDGQTQDVSWVTDIQLLGDCMMHNIGECHNEESAYVYSLTSTENPPQRYYLNLSEKPSIPKPTKLSQILESNPDPKYNLSAKACQGILNRAEKRGKELPELLRIALTKQAGGGIRTFDVRISSEGTKNQRAHCYETDRSRSLDTGGENPDSNHGGVTIIQRRFSNVNTFDDDISPTLEPGAMSRVGGHIYDDSTGSLRANAGDNQQVVCYATQASGDRDNASQSFQEETAYTIPSNPMSDRGQAICVGIDLYNQTTTGEVTKTLNAVKSDSDHVPCVVNADRGGMSQLQQVKPAFF